MEVVLSNVHQFPFILKIPNYFKQSHQEVQKYIITKNRLAQHTIITIIPKQVKSIEKSNKRQMIIGKQFSGQNLFQNEKVINRYQRIQSSKLSEKKSQNNLQQNSRKTLKFQRKSFLEDTFIDKLIKFSPIPAKKEYAGDQTINSIQQSLSQKKWQEKTKSTNVRVQKQGYKSQRLLANSKSLPLLQNSCKLKEKQRMNALKHQLEHLEGKVIILKRTSRG